MLQRFLAFIINLWIGFLESSFQKDPRFQNQEAKPDFFSESSSSAGEDEWGKASKAQALLKEAYEFMELTPPCELDQVKKQYKKLSLRHHPDRNGGSKESHELMQKLNACLVMIEKDIVQQQGDTEEEEDEEHEEEKRRAQDDFVRQQREQMQREMEEELKKYNNLKKEFKQNKEKDKSHCYRKQKELNLNSVEGRRAAHESFCQQMKQTVPSEKKESSNEKDATTSSNMTGIDEWENDDQKASEKETTAPNKPKNYIMEYNMDDIVVAMRLGMPDIAIGVMEEQINAFIQSRAQDAFFTGNTGGISMASLGVEFLLRPLDFDDNTLLHYAVYYEVYQVVRAVCGTALKFGGLEAVVYQRNKYSQTALTFSKIAKDESIQKLIESQVAMVERTRTQTKFLPAVKSAFLRSLRIARNIDLVATFSTILSFGIGFKIFNLHIMTSMLGVMFMQYVSGDVDKDDSCVPGIPEVTILISFLLTWKLARFFVVSMYYQEFIMIELVLILMPFGIPILLSLTKSRLVDAILFPMAVQGYIARYLERFLSFVHGYITPKVIIRKGLVKPFFLILLASFSLGINQLSF